jgi:hypothetical protein
MENSPCLPARWPMLYGRQDCIAEHELVSAFIISDSPGLLRKQMKSSPIYSLFFLLLAFMPLKVISWVWER